MTSISFAFELSDGAKFHVDDATPTYQKVQMKILEHPSQGRSAEPNENGAVM